MKTIESRNLIVESIKEKGMFGYSIMVEIQGKYLIENNLVEAWSILRGQSIKEISSPGYVDSISLVQSLHLGLLDFVFGYADVRTSLYK